MSDKQTVWELLGMTFVGVLLAVVVVALLTNITIKERALSDLNRLKNEAVERKFAEYVPAVNEIKQSVIEFRWKENK